MLALGEQHGAKIWSLLDDDELREISIIMSTIGTIEAELVENLLLEFVSRMSASGALMGTYDATERLLQQYLPPERVGNIMDEIRGPAGRNMWEKLSNVQEEVLANYLKNEYPQTVAVVLSKIGPDHAARVLAILPEELALDVVNRMLRMEAVQKEVLERVETTLRTEFMSNLSQTRRRDAHEVMAEIFNNFDRQTETRFLTALEEDNRESAERIKTLMFTFDDLIKLDPVQIWESQRALADLLPKLTQPVDAPLRRVARYDRRVDGADRNSRDPVWMGDRLPQEPRRPRPDRSRARLRPAAAGRSAQTVSVGPPSGSREPAARGNRDLARPLLRLQFNAPVRPIIQDHVRARTGKRTAAGAAMGHTAPIWAITAMTRNGAVTAPACDKRR